MRCFLGLLAPRIGATRHIWHEFAVGLHPRRLRFPARQMTMRSQMCISAPPASRAANGRSRYRLARHPSVIGASRSRRSSARVARPGRRSPSAPWCGAARMPGHGAPTAGVGYAPSPRSRLCSWQSSGRDRRTERYRALVLVLALGGLRFGGATAMRRSDVLAGGAREPFRTPQRAAEQERQAYRVPPSSWPCGFDPVTPRPPAPRPAVAPSRRSP
jgi:hypothetical protein